MRCVCVLDVKRCLVQIEASSDDTAIIVQKPIDAGTGFFMKDMKQPPVLVPLGVKDKIKGDSGALDITWPIKNNSCGHKPTGHERRPRR